MTSTPESNRRRRIAPTIGLSLMLSVSTIAFDAVLVSAAPPAVRTVSGLSQGSRGDSVKQLQRALVDQGMALRGGVDGIFGPSTMDAVRAFQETHGLEATGAVDDATATALGLGPSPLVGLERGARSNAVKQLQQALINQGLSIKGGADGIFGPDTQRVLTEFQASRGLDATGVVDEATVAALAGPAAQPTASGAGPLLGLGIGARGDAVRQLQQTLIDAGYTMVGGADGIFGVATANALSQFQYAAGISVNAKVDDATAAALAEAGVASPPAANPVANPATNPAPNAMVGLGVGSYGNGVKQVQQALIDAGIKFPGGADGIFGPATSKALKTFQSSQGLDATGKVDDATAAALNDPKPAQTPSTGGYAEFGERGVRVTALQESLVNAGISVPGGVDGMFGSGTAGAVMNFQRAHSFTVTGVVDSAVASALGLEAMDKPQAVDPSTVTLDAFPVQGQCYFGDTWHAARGGGRKHEGVDIIAAEGLYIYAVADGEITKRYWDQPGALAGNGVRLTADDGTYYFYAHMLDVKPGIEVGSRVKAGEIIGFVGNTGSSATAHLHLEIHPKGGAAINPYPIVKAIDACNSSEIPPQP